MNFFPSNIRYLREAHEIKIPQFLKIIGRSKTTLFKYEKGETQPDIDVLQRLSREFNVSYYELIEVDLEKHARELELDPENYDCMEKPDLIKKVKEYQGRYQESEAKLKTFKSDINNYINAKLNL